MTVTFDEILDKQVWERFFLQHQPEALFQSWEWGEVQKKTGHTITRYGIWHAKTLIGIFLAVAVIARRGSFLHIRHGPIFSTYTPDLWERFTDFCAEITKQKQLLFFRISPLIFPEPESAQLFSKLHYRSAAIHAMDAELCWVLPLKKSSDELLQDMRKTTRYEIRKAEKMGVTVDASQKIENLNSFFDLYKQTSQRQGFVRHGGILQEFEVFTKNNKAELYLASFEGKTIAAAIILFVGNQAIYHHGASINSAPPGSYLIQCNAILDAKKRGLNQYNFWGIADDTNMKHPWKGITLFKKGFGGKEKRYIHALDYPVSPLYVFPNMIETIRRIQKGY